MVGYFLALLVDKLTGATLLDQQGSFLGLLSLHVVVFAVLLFPTLDRVQVPPPPPTGPPCVWPHGQAVSAIWQSGSRLPSMAFSLPS